MKLASYNDGSRDGALVVVSRDLSLAHYATGIATRMQQVLDDWNFLSPQLQDLYDALNHGRAMHPFDFEPERCMAPLPRAFQRLQAQAYSEHIALSALADTTLAPADEGAKSSATPTPRRAPLMLRQCSGDDLQGPREAIIASREAMNIDFGAQLAAITADVRRGSSPEQGLDAVRLLMLANTPCLRAVLGGDDSVAGMADVLAWPGAAFSPVAITPDELNETWRGGKVQLTLQCHWNGRRVGLLDAGLDVGHGFGQIVSQAAQTRHLRAGTIVAAGIVANRSADKKGRPDWPKGYACIADKRGMEVQIDGEAKTAYMQFGDTIRIDMKGKDGQSLFGAIDQEVINWQTHAARTRAQEAAQTAQTSPERGTAEDSVADDGEGN